jgi:hypothetical protein
MCCSTFFFIKKFSSSRRNIYSLLFGIQPSGETLFFIEIENCWFYGYGGFWVAVIGPPFAVAYALATPRICNIIYLVAQRFFAKKLS